MSPRLVVVICLAIGCGAQHAHDGAHDARSLDTSRANLDAGHGGSSAVDAAPGGSSDARSTAADAQHADAGSVMDAGSAPDLVTVACYRQNAPAATCTSPDHCCFTNYDAYHNGACSASTCSWGTIDCDGPEDCAAGQHCCSHVLRDPALGITGYLVACQSAACSQPSDHELCHVGATCPSGQTCVPVEGHVNSLPRALSICE